MKHKYGEFSNIQISLMKHDLRKQIFFLLLCADENTKHNYPNINLNDAFCSLLYKLGGLNSILFSPPELVMIISLLEVAYIKLNEPYFDFATYRKLILDAGAKVSHIKEDC